VHETPAFCVLARTCRSPVPALLFHATICLVVSGVSCDRMLRSLVHRNLWLCCRNRWWVLMWHALLFRASPFLRDRVDLCVW